MKKELKIVLVAFVAILAIVVFEQCFFIVDEGEQAVVTRFGKIVNVTTSSGLKAKMPFVDQVVKYTKMILSWDGEAQRIPTKENQFIYIDPTSRWRITDPQLFYETVKSVNNAQNRLDDILDSVIRTVISENYLAEAVRNSNAINEINVVEASLSGVDDLEEAESLRNLTQTSTSQDSIAKGREALSNEMLYTAREYVKQYGIYLEDIVIRQIRYSDDLTLSVYERMIKERNQIAEAYRSYGRGQKAKWEGKTENERKSILSAAYAEAEQIKGTADAKAAAIYSESYSANPEFFELWRTFDSYTKNLGNQTMVLSTDMSYFDLFY